MAGEKEAQVLKPPLFLSWNLVLVDHGEHRAFLSLCARLCGTEVLYVSSPPQCREGPEAGGGQGLSVIELGWVP